MKYLIRYRDNDSYYRYYACKIVTNNAGRPSFESFCIADGTMFKPIVGNLKLIRKIYKDIGEQNKYIYKNYSIEILVF